MFWCTTKQCCIQYCAMDSESLRTTGLENDQNIIILFSKYTQMTEKSHAIYVCKAESPEISENRFHTW